MCLTKDRDLAAKSGNVIAKAAQLAEIIQKRTGAEIDPHKLINLLKCDWERLAPIAHDIHSHERRRGFSDRRS